MSERRTTFGTSRLNLPALQAVVGSAACAGAAVKRPAAKAATSAARTGRPLETIDFLLLRGRAETDTHYHARDPGSQGLTRCLTPLVHKAARSCVNTRRHSSDDAAEIGPLTKRGHRVGQT